MTAYDELVREIIDAVNAIGSIYPSIGKAMYDEPRDRLSQRVATLVRDKYGDSFASPCQECGVIGGVPLVGKERGRENTDDRSDQLAISRP